MEIPVVVPLEKSRGLWEGSVPEFSVRERGPVGGVPMGETAGFRLTRKTQEYSPPRG
jgi:hypothetical protein